MKVRNKSLSHGSRHRKVSSNYSVLENRRLLAVSVTLDGSVLTILGDGVANDVLVETNNVDDTYDVTLDFGGANTPAGSFPQSSVTEIEFTGRSGDDIMRNSTSLPMTAYGNAGNDTFFGGQSVDTIYAGNGDDVLFGSGGADVLHGHDGHDAIHGGADNDFINGGPVGDSIFGNDGDDTIYGAEGNDVIFAGAGNDTVYGYTGDDSLYGDEGDDLLFGQADNDTIRGGDGVDRLRGNPGEDNLDGEAGNDFVKGDQDNDEMEGGEGDDIMHGWTGNDRMIGGAGNDLMYGQDGDDYMNGGDGNDVVRGGNGNDRLYGENGNDFVRGDEGLDGISGGLGSGSDRLFGNDGADRYLTESTDRIMDATEEDAILVFENDSSEWNDAELELMDSALEVMHHRTGATLILSDLTTNENLVFTKVADIAGDAFGANTLSVNGNDYTRLIQFEEFDEEGLFDSADFTTSVYTQIARNFDSEFEFSFLNQLGASDSFYSDWLALSDWLPEVEGNPGNFYDLSNDQQWYFSTLADFTFASKDANPKDNPASDFAVSWEYYFDNWSNDRSPVGMQSKYDWFHDLFGPVV